MSESTQTEPATQDAAESAEAAEASAPAKKKRRKHPVRSLEAATQNGGWMWMEKEAIGRILLKTNQRQSAMIVATYAALCRLSSDRGNATSVTAGMGMIANLSGCSKRTVIRAVEELERVKLVAVRRVRRGNRNEENTYFLLACGARGSRRKVVTEGHEGSDCESPGVVTENGQFSGTELKERRNSKSSSYSLKAKTPLAAAALADAAQQPRRFANEDGRKVRGLGSW